ncbi:MAG TPA: shikimate kinase [Xanthomonadaceae bacterium]|nr:shikimate kinase [Xanthomonadaceae bacterium]
MDSAPNLVLVGPMGAGKTSIGKRLAERLDLAFADSDRAVEAQTGVRVATIFDCEGEAGFRARERASLAALLAGEGRLVATGGGAILHPATRDLMRARGFVVHLRVGIDEQLDRLAHDRTRPLIAGDDREAVLRRLAAEREPLYAALADLSFDTDGLGPAEACARLGHLLDSRWRRGAAA